MAPQEGPAPAGPFFVSLPLWFIFNFGVTFLVTGFAMWKGGRTEQAAGLFIFLATIMTFL